MRLCPRNRVTRIGRRGAVIVAALVCLLIVVALLGALLQGTLRGRRQLIVQRDGRQCELLADAGLARAMLRLTMDLDYRGETWSVPADDSVGLAAGQVTISVKDVSENRRRVSLVAEYPLGNEQSIRRSRSVSISKESTPEQE